MSYRTSIYDERIAWLFSQNGDVGSFANHLRAEMLRYAVEATPKRSGNLLAHNNSSYLRRGGASAKSCTVILGNSASYAAYVHEGTTGVGGRIYPRRSPYLKVPATPGFGTGSRTGFLRLPSVKTQGANPWLVAAADRAVRQLVGFTTDMLERYGQF